MKEANWIFLQRDERVTSSVRGGFGRQQGNQRRIRWPFLLAAEGKVQRTALTGAAGAAADRVRQWLSRSR
jgi:hypothetical protein